MDILNEINSDPKSLSPLVLAYIGDAVFELMVRGYVLKDGNAPVNKLNKKSRNIVNAGSQSEMYEKLKDVLTETEMAVMKEVEMPKVLQQLKIRVFQITDAQQV